MVSRSVFIAAGAIDGYEAGGSEGGEQRRGGTERIVEWVERGRFERIEFERIRQRIRQRIGRLEWWRLEWWIR